MAKKNSLMEKAFQTILILFALFLIVQVLRKMFGGSWTIEDIILGLIILNLGSIFTLGVMFAQLKSDHDHLRAQFGSLASDFKSFLDKK